MDGIPIANHLFSKGVKDKVVSREYTDLFYQHIMLRPSCANCHFANVNRVGDLTLADFWGIEKHSDTFNDNKGVSLLLLNTEKGRTFFDIVKSEFEYFECAVENCMQPTLVKPSIPSPRREAFWKDYSKLTIDELIKKYNRPHTSIGRAKRSVKKLLYRIGVRKHP